MRSILKGSTDQSVVVRIIDSTDGTPETGVTSATGGLAIEYRRELEASNSIGTINDLAALTTAHNDAGIKHIGNGYYRVDLPDAAVATGKNGVLIHGTATGMVMIGCYLHLVDYNPQDPVRLGLTALPNAAADAAGGLPISDAGGLDLDELLVRLPEVVTGTVNDAGPAVGDFDGSAGLSATDDFYNGCVLVFTTGINIGIARRIDDYTGSSKNLVFSAAPWITAPSNGDAFKILGRIN